MVVSHLWLLNWFYKMSQATHASLNANTNKTDEFAVSCKSYRKDDTKNTPEHMHMLVLPCIENKIPLFALINQKSPNKVA